MNSRITQTLFLVLLFGQINAQSFFNTTGEIQCASIFLGSKAILDNPPIVNDYNKQNLNSSQNSTLIGSGGLVLTCNNQMFSANPLMSDPTGECYASIILEASATDSLICADQSGLQWQVCADLWNNGTIDRIGSSQIDIAYDGIWLHIFKYLATGNLNPEWVKIQAIFANLVLADDVYVTHIEPSPASGGSVKLPAFDLIKENVAHTVVWKVKDGCDNVDICEAKIMSVDKKAPTPYCVSIYTANLQSNPKFIELWAVNFNKGSFDNCTEQSKLCYTFDGTQPVLSRINEVHYFKGVGEIATLAEYNLGKAYKWSPPTRSAGHIWLVDGEFAVDVSVWDEAWNTDFCTVSVSLGCTLSAGSNIAGNVKTFKGQPVNGVDIVIQSSGQPEYPMVVTTDTSGTYLKAVNYNYNYIISARKGGDYLNGVSTIDLVLMQRHILGRQSITNPYLLIAADADNNRKITSNDLLELRKLILGLYRELPNNASWRFPIAAQTLNPMNPFPFVEEIVLFNLMSDQLNQNFVAVKIGDIDGNVNVGAVTAVETRTAKKVGFAVENLAIVAGETVRIPVTASNYNDIFGFQFTIGVRGAQFVEVESGALAVTNANVGVHTGKLTMSYSNDEAESVTEGEVLFTLVMKATESTTLGEALHIGSDIIPAESYIGNDMEIGKVSLEFRNAEASEFALYQNEPNPFRTETVIRYNMPEAGSATITVYDVAGKVAAQRVVKAAKGMNTEKYTRADINASGVLLYKVESGDHVATKKMIIID